MKTFAKIIILSLYLGLSMAIFSQNVTVYLTVSGGSLSSEKWVRITTGANSTGTVVWAQGNGNIGNGAGYLTDQAISVPCGQTLYLNTYDKYDDGWDGTKYTLRTATGGGGTLIINNSNASPSDGADTDASSSWDASIAELETSESFSVTCPCNPTIGTLTSNVTNCFSGLFSVSLTINSAGPGYSSVTVSDGVNPNQTVSTFPTTVTFGNYTAGTTVSLNVTNGTCSIVSNSVTETCPIGYSCALAQPITNGFTTSSNIVSPGTDGVQNWVTNVSGAMTGTASSAGFVNSDVRIFSYTSGATAGESFYFTIDHNSAVVGEHSIGVFTSCSGGTLSGCIGSTYSFDDVVGVCVQNMPANTTYYIAVAKEWYSLDGEGLDFAVIDFTVETSSTIPSDECNTASLINVADPYNGSTRCNYSASAGSPSTFPNSCGTIENDSWMRFTAGSATVVIDYEVYDCMNNDGVQLSVFSGSCGSLTMLSGSCINYASNNATGTWTFTGLTPGNTYYIRTDGYAGDLCSYAFNPVSGVVILPIEMTDFQATPMENAYNKLSWKTFSENNSAYFEVERSFDGKTFEAIEQVQAAGNSSSVRSYQFMDKVVSTGDVYYRIKAFNANGTFSLSEIKRLTNTKAADFSIYPNPSRSEQVTVFLSNPKDVEAVLVFDLRGNVVMEVLPISKNENELKLNVADLHNGLYIVQVKTTTEIVEKKLLIAK